MACIKNNGWLSEAFELHRGVRQGCPLSALLFILCVETLACKIRQNQNIQGFKFSHNGKIKSIKISQYADNTIYLS